MLKSTYRNLSKFRYVDFSKGSDLMDNSIESKSKLSKIAKYILFNEKGLITENKEYKNRLNSLEIEREKQAEKILVSMIKTDWINLDIQEREIKFENMMSNLSNVEEDISNLYFEIGMRCGVILFEDLSTNYKSFENIEEE